MNENNGASTFKPISLMYSMLKLKLKNIGGSVCIDGNSLLFPCVHICFNSGIMVCVTQSGFQAIFVFVVASYDI